MTADEPSPQPNQSHEMPGSQTCSPTYLNKPVSYWLRYVADPDPLHRRLGAHTLGLIGAEAGPDAVAALTAALDDPKNFVRIWAAAALASVDSSQGRAFAVLLAGLHDEQSFVRSLSAWHLGRLSAILPDKESTVPLLQQLLQDDDPSVRAEAELAIKALQADSARPAG